MQIGDSNKTVLLVALRKESVDRNRLPERYKTNFWVALRKESVDRNAFMIKNAVFIQGRSPQGERG